ncbi:hypothetical protein OAS39_04170 [Pirellulales bacterium]|nr:hypothetical protein [Pirellulales bacterium]
MARHEAQAAPIHAEIDRSRNDRAAKRFDGKQTADVDARDDLSERPFPAAVRFTAELSVLSQLPQEGRS